MLAKFLLDVAQHTALLLAAASRNLQIPYQNIDLPLFTIFDNLREPRKEKQTVGSDCHFFHCTVTSIIMVKRFCHVKI